MKKDIGDKKGNSLIIAVVLSAFAFPGTGQLYLGRKVLGGAILLLTTLFLALLFMDIYGNIQKVLPRIIAETEGMDLPNQFVFIQGIVHDEVELLRSGIYSLSLFFLWLFSILELFRPGIKKY